jgi:transposase
MKQCYGCDAHKKYSLFASINETGRYGYMVKVEHDRRIFRNFLSTLPSGSPIAVESVGNWYWLIDEMEKAGHIPMLAHAAKAKLMMGQTNKTDKLDARGLALLLHNGTLPSVWIPPSGLRDQRELPRMRMALVRVRTMLKNRIHATLAKYAICITEVSDIFGVGGRRILETRLGELPPQTRSSVKTQLKLLDQVEKQINLSEKQIEAIIKTTPEMRLLMTLPGVGPILAIVIALEIGQIDRFPSAQHLASYGGTVPRVKSSGGRTFYGKVRPDVNRYLKWALIEAANVIVLNQSRMLDRHVVQLYNRIMKRKGHAKAVVAVARHLGEATYWILKKNEPYKEPKRRKLISSTQE